MADMTIKKYLTLIIFLLSAFLAVHTNAQLIKVDHQRGFTDSLRNELINAPYFGLFKDNYFTVGTAVGAKPTRNNSDVKFQISIAQRLTKTTLPGNSFIFLMYTQKTFWNVFEKSLPMHDLNFNPGIGWSIPFFSKGRYAGKFTLLLEHESNGRDSLESRSLEPHHVLRLNNYRQMADGAREILDSDHRRRKQPGHSEILRHLSGWSCRDHSRQKIRMVADAGQTDWLEFQFQHHFRVQLAYSQKIQSIPFCAILQRIWREPPRL